MKNRKPRTSGAMVVNQAHPQRDAQQMVRSPRVFDKRVGFEAREAHQ